MEETQRQNGGDQYFESYEDLEVSRPALVLAFLLQNRTTTLNFSDSRTNATRQTPNGGLSRRNFGQSLNFPGQIRLGCRLWHWITVDVLR